MSDPRNRRTPEGFVAGNLAADLAEWQRIFALPDGERQQALTEHIRVRRERAAEYAARDVESLYET